MSESVQHDEQCSSLHAEGLVGGLAEEEEVFLKSRDRSRISNCISHTLCWPCCSFVY